MNIHYNSCNLCIKQKTFRAVKCETNINCLLLKHFPCIFEEIHFIQPKCEAHNLGFQQIWKALVIQSQSSCIVVINLKFKLVYSVGKLGILDSREKNICLKGRQAVGSEILMVCSNNTAETSATTLSITATQRHPSLPPSMDNVNMMGHHK